MLVRGSLRQDRSDASTRLGESARDFAIRQFERFRADLGVVEFKSESRAIVLQHRKFFFEIAALCIGREAALAGGFELVERGQKAFEGQLKLGVSAHRSGI